MPPPRRSSVALDPGRAAEVGGAVTIPGRLELIAEHPPTYVDAAHNPAGAAALAESLPAVAGGRPVVACLAILADKDAAAMVAALAPALDRAVCTELPRAALEGHGRPGARSRPAAELAAALRGGGPAGGGGARLRARSAARRRRSPPSRPRASCWSPAPTMQSAPHGALVAPDCARIRAWIVLAAPVPNCSR